MVEKGVFCVKGYGIIQWVETAQSAYCLISGNACCANCDVNLKDEAAKEHQVSRTGGERKGKVHHL